MDSHWVGVWIPMVNGTWVPLNSPTSWKNNTSSWWNTKLKLQGWCVNVNSFSYVSDPNMQCFEAEWNHFVSCFDPHSHVSTKLVYVCDIFV
jgi:hypothetical protein